MNGWLLARDHDLPHPARPGVRRTVRRPARCAPDRARLKRSRRPAPHAAQRRGHSA